MTRLALGHSSFPGVLQREKPSSWESGGRWALERGSGPRDQRTGSPTSDSVTSSMPIPYRTGTTNADSQDLCEQAQRPAREWGSMGADGCQPDTQAHTQARRHSTEMPKCPRSREGSS